MNKDELINKIRLLQFDAPGSSGKGRIYHEIPFEGYEDVTVAREENEKRFQQLINSYDFRGKKVLDIGCSIGYYSFKLASQGAECWGIDADGNSIFVANSLKEIHKVDNVHFTNGFLTNSTIDKLLEESGGFDVILLFSVIHWLLKANRNEENVIKLLQRLIKDKQVIFYEPSISGKAYYPNTLKKECVGSFLKRVGYNKIKLLGKNYAKNVSDSRELYLGKIDFNSIMEQIKEYKESYNTNSNKNNFFSIYRYRETDKKNEFYKYENYFIKCNNYKSRKGIDKFIFENEAKWLENLQKYDFIPKYFGKYKMDDQICLIMEDINGTSLDKASWVMEKSFDRCFPKLIDNLYKVLEIFKKEGIVHKDLCPQNIIINENMNIFKIIDFQFCSKLGERMKTSSKEQEIFYNNCLKNVGREWRKPNLIEFNYETDRYSVEKILNSLSPAKRIKTNRDLILGIKFILKKLFPFKLLKK